MLPTVKNNCWCALEFLETLKKEEMKKTKRIQNRIEVISVSESASETLDKHMTPVRGGRNPVQVFSQIAVTTRAATVLVHYLVA
jgi:hypothetical protein